MKYLYHIKDSDRPMWVIANGWNEALTKWMELIAKENNMEPKEVDGPLGIDFVCGPDELIL